MYCPTIVDTVDVSDICADFDRVGAFGADDDGQHQVTAFCRNGSFMTETSIDLSRYPAVVAVASRGLDVPGELKFEAEASTTLEF